MRLAEIAEINPRQQRRPAADQEVSFLGMAEIGAKSGTTTAGETVPFAKVSKGYTIFRDKDLLVAKITPCFQNGKIAQANLMHEIGVGSTEFHVVRPRPDQLDARYALHLLRHPHVREAGERRMTGSGGQRRVPEAYLAELDLPVPSLDQQRRVADILDLAVDARSKRHETVELMNDLQRAVFLKMFGDPVDSATGAQLSTVGEVSELVTDGEHQTPQRAADGVRLLSARNIRDGHLDLRDVDYVDQAEFERLRRRLEPRQGDILISCSGSIGRVAQVRDQAPFAMVRSVALVRPDRNRVSPTYLEHQLRLPRMKALMQRRANASSQANLFQKDIRPLPVLVPPMKTQLEFERRVLAISEVERAYTAHSAGLEELFLTLQEQAFAGLL